MIEHPAFTIEEWSVRETELHLDTLAQTESIFALSNGHIGLRGNLDEGNVSAPLGSPPASIPLWAAIRLVAPRSVRKSGSS